MAIDAEAVAAWPGIRIDGPLAGGARTEAYLAHRDGRRLVVHRRTRAAVALDWEMDLLEHLGRHGVGVPEVVPAADGRRHAGGVVVQRFVPGRPPGDRADWHRVVDTLVAVHAATIGWPQRPGFASARRLMVTDRGGDVRLDAMPPSGVRAVRAAWRPVLRGAECAVHGDVGPGNIRIDGPRLTLVDWDEARVDVEWFDFAFLPGDVSPPGGAPDRRALDTAGVAWEAATCWTAEPAYAARRLAELYRRTGGRGRWDRRAVPGAAGPGG